MPETSGHKISPAELLKSVEQYEDSRAEQFEINYQNKKFGELPTTEEIKKVFDKIKSEAPEIIKDNQTADEKLQEKVLLKESKDLKWKELSEKALRNEITEQEFLTQWKEFTTK